MGRLSAIKVQLELELHPCSTIKNCPGVALNIVFRETPYYVWIHTCCDQLISWQEWKCQIIRKMLMLVLGACQTSGACLFSLVYLGFYVAFNTWGMLVDAALISFPGHSLRGPRVQVTLDSQMVAALELKVTRNR